MFDYCATVFSQVPRIHYEFSVFVFRAPDGAHNAPRAHLCMHARAVLTRTQIESPSNTKKQTIFIIKSIVGRCKRVCLQVRRNDRNPLNIRSLTKFCDTLLDSYKLY